jgi:hypothetical protein
MSFLEGLFFEVENCSILAFRGEGLLSKICYNCRLILQ